MSKSKKTASNPDQPCPCGQTTKQGKALTLSQCCGPFLEGQAKPETAEQLMRSRYSAYVLQRFDYVRQTWWPESCPNDLEDNNPDERLHWIGLTVRRHECSPQTPTEAIVEFIARYKVGGKAYRMHETSCFTRKDGRWYYVEGTQHEA